MKKIRLYQIPFSHFCDKIRWSLDYFDINSETINYSQSNRKCFRSIPKEVRHLYPIIEDESIQPSKYLSDSTSILIYLNDFYSNERKSLFPSNQIERDQIIEYCLMLDNQLGLYSRRFAYLYLINECPEIISVLIDGNYSFDQQKKSKSSLKLFDQLKKKFNGYLISTILIERFRLDQILNENLFEKNEKLLNKIQFDLKEKKYLFNDQFSAADLTLTSLIYPLKLIDSIRIRHSTLFNHIEQIRNEFDPNETQMKFIENSLEKHRNNSSKLNRFLQQTIHSILFYLFSLIYFPFRSFIHRIQSNQFEYPSTSTSSLTSINDQRIIRFNSKRSMLKIFFINSYHYFVSIPKQIRQIENKFDRKSSSNNKSI